MPESPCAAGLRGEGKRTLVHAQWLQQMEVEVSLVARSGYGFDHHASERVADVRVRVPSARPAAHAQHRLAGCYCLSERHIRGRRFAEDVRDARIVEARGVIQQVSDAYRIIAAHGLSNSMPDTRSATRASSVSRPLTSRKIAAATSVLATDPTCTRSSTLIRVPDGILDSCCAQGDVPSVSTVDQTAPCRSCRRNSAAMAGDKSGVEPNAEIGTTIESSRTLDNARQAKSRDSFHQDNGNHASRHPELALLSWVLRQDLR